MEGEIDLTGVASSVTALLTRTPAEGDLTGWDRYLGPTPGYDEQVYFLKLLGDASGQTEILLQNAAATRGSRRRVRA